MMYGGHRANVLKAQLRSSGVQGPLAYESRAAKQCEPQELIISYIILIINVHTCVFKPTRMTTWCYIGPSVGQYYYLYYLLVLLFTLSRLECGVSNHHIRRGLKNRLQILLNDAGPLRPIRLETIKGAPLFLRYGLTVLLFLSGCTSF